MTPPSTPATPSARQRGLVGRFGLPAAAVLLLEGALLFSWSAGFVGTRYAVEQAPPFLVLFWRSLISALVMLPWAVQGIRRLNPRDVARQIGFGVFGMAAYSGSFTVALHRGASTGVVALVMDLLPLAVALLTWPVLRTPLTHGQWIGTALGTLGGWIAADLSNAASPVAPSIYAIPLLGMFATAVITLLQSDRQSTSMPLLQLLCVQCFTASLVFAVLAGSAGNLAPVPTWQFAGAIAWLVIFATFGSWGLYYATLRFSTASRVTATLFLSPPITAVWAWLAFDEPPSLTLAVGFAMSLAGVYIAIRSAPR